MYSRRQVFAGALLLVISTMCITVFLMTGGLSISAVAQSADGTRWDILNEISAQMQGNYVEPVTPEQLRVAAIRGMVSAPNDPHTTYMDTKEYAQLMQYMRAEFTGGIGCLLSLEKVNGLKISKITKGMGAEAAGMLSGDIIVGVDGKDIRKMDHDLAVQLVRGEPDTTVELSVIRAGQAQPLKFKIVRKALTFPTVYGALLKSNKALGYLQVISFSEKTGTEFATALHQLQKQGAKGFIIDLRQNGGGLLSAAVEMGQEIIPKGVIVTVRGRSQTTDQVYRSSLAKSIGPLVILVDGGSASASEVIAEAVRDSKVGKLVGEKTYGKGSVQRIFQLSDGSALKITTDRFYSPLGKNVGGKGLQPDVFVKSEPTKLFGPDDPQLNKAVSVVAEQLKKLGK